MSLCIRGMSVARSLSRTRAEKNRGERLSLDLMTHTAIYGVPGLRMFATKRQKL